MKVIIERISGGVKRLLVLALGLGLASTGWATAPTATAVWQSGEFKQTKNGYSITLNDNVINADGNIVITDNATGAYIDVGAVVDSATALTVLIGYSAAPTPSSRYQAPISFYGYGVNSKSDLEIGLVNWATSGLSLGRFYAENGGTTITPSNFSTQPALSNSGGYLLLSYNLSTINAFAGSAISSMNGTSQANWVLSDRKLRGVAIGGQTGQISNTKLYNSWTGLTINRVAIFVGNAYSNEDLKEYTFPTAGRYANWEYAKDVFTWTSASTADMSSGNATYYLFDRASGMDTATEYNGGSTAYTGGGNFWKYWTMRQPNYYSAPGFVLRLISGKQSTIGGSFAPLTLGGMIVEKGATGYNFYHAQGSDADSVYGDGKSHRTTIFGDCTGETETWFKFEESVSFNRPGRNRLSGTVNFDVASGNIVSINTDTTTGGYSADFDPAIYQTVNETGKNAATLTAGGALKMHGEGTIAVNTLTATNSVLDYSDLGNRLNTNPFINGTLAINEGTTFILPEGAASPYKVATGISATAYPSFITIGGKKYAATVSDGANAGEIAWEINEATIDVAGDDYALSTIFTDPSSTKDYSLTVTADATLDVGTTEVRAITIDVAEGKTLTLSGTSLTATTIYITGKGSVKASTGGALVGTVKGDGTLIYTVKPTLGTGNLVATDDAWEGVLWIKGTSVDIAALKPNDSAGVNSTIRLTGCTGYFNNNGELQVSTGTLDLQDDGETKAFTVTNGYTENGITKFAKLTGSGTFKADTGTAQRYVFLDVSGFDGVLDIPSGKNTRVIFGNSTDNAGNGTLFVASGATVTNKAGKVWTVQGGVRVEGDFTVENTCSMKFTYISGTLNIASGKVVTLTGNTDSLNYGGSGTVNVYGTLNMGTTRWTIGSSNVINLYEGGTISGAGESTYGALDWYTTGTLNVYGTSTISANIRCRDEGDLSFNVASGVCTFSGESYGSKPITKTGAGTLKIAYAGSSSYNVPSVGEGTVEFNSGAFNLGSLRNLSGYTMADGGSAVVKVVQTLDEYANGSNIVVSNIDSSIDSIKVVLATGTEETLTVSDSSATYSGSGTITVGGKACTFDWEFNGDLTSVGYNTTSLSGSSVFDEGNQKLYVRSAPYYNSGSYGTWTWADNWTVAIKATMPARGKDIVIAFGTKTGGVVALVTSPNDGKVKLVRTTKDEAATDISEMTVADRSGAEHLYIFAKTSDGKMQVYCDDTLIDNKEVAGIASLPGTLQVGSIHGAKGNSGLTTPESTDNAAIDFLQVYNYGISEAMRNKIIEDYAWINPNKYTRTVSDDENLSSTDAWTKPSDSSTVAIPITDADAIITTSSSSAALTVNTDFEADTLTINSGAEGAALRLKAGTGTLVAAKVVINVPVIVEYGAVDFSGSVVTFGEDGSLTYDFSGVAINSRTTRLVAKLTGLISAPADLADSSAWPVQVTTHSDASSLADCYESTFSYDTTDSAYYYICGPDHDWGSDVYYTGGYWSSDSRNTISVTNASGVATKVFSGDTVVIPSYYPNATTWSDNTLPANVTKIRVSKSKIKVCSGANSGDIFTGVTWTVDSGCVLWFGVDTKTTSLGAMTINGPGSVECGNITINGAMSGDAPVKILDSVTTRLTSTGSIASTHTISGNASALISCAAVPSAMTFASGWAGTVELPSFAATGQQLNNYGVSGSKIKINGITSGYLIAQSQTFQPEIVLAGNFNITDMSQRDYTFSKFSGTGDITFTPATYDLTALTITELAEGYSGTVANNMASTTLNIGTLALESGTSVVGGTKILPTGGTGTISVGAVTVGGEAQSFDLCYESDGVYVAAAEYNSVNYYSVAAAIAVAGDANLEDITLLNGCTTVPAGYYIDSGSLAKYQAAVVDTDGVAHYYATAQAAVDDIMSYNGAGGNPTYDFFELYYGANVSISLSQTWLYGSFKLKLLNGATVSLSGPSVEYTVQEGSTVESVTSYSVVSTPTTYVWTDAGTGSNWSTKNNWAVGAVDGDTPLRAPEATDYFVVSSGSVTLSANTTAATLTVNGVATFTAELAKTLTVTSGEIVFANASSSVTLTNVSLENTTPTTTVANSYVKLDGSTYSVDTYKTLTIVPNYSTVTVTTNSVAAVGVNDVYTLEAGEVTITVTPDSGYAVTGIAASSGTVTGSGPYSYTVSADATITVTTVSTSITIDSPNVAYYASYTNATVTANVTGEVLEGTTFTLSGIGITGTYNGTYENGVVTFNNVHGYTLGDTITYTISATGGSSGTLENQSSAVGGGSAVASNAWMKWTASEHAENSSWTTNGVPNITEIPYSEGAAALNGTNVYSAAWVSTGEVVTVTTSVKFGDVADQDLVIDADAQAAIRIGLDESVNTFQLLTGANTWTSVYNDTLGAPDGDTEYAVTIKLDYTKQKYGVTITQDATPYILTNASNEAEFTLARNASQMQKVSYLGAGSFKSIAGSYISAGYTADIGTTGNATNVVVSSDFVSNYMGDVLASNVSTALSPNAARTCTNGLNYFESYALGLNPTVEEEKPVVEVTTDENGKFVVTLKKANGTTITPAANVALKVTMKAGSTPDAVTGDGEDGEIEATSETSTFTIDPTKMSGNVMYYKVKVDIGAK